VGRAGCLGIHSGPFPGAFTFCRETLKNERQPVAKEDTIVSGVAARYAGALFELAQEHKVGDTVLKDLETFDAMVAGSADLDRFVRSPVFGADEQVRALEPILKQAGISGLAANFLKLIASKRRLFAVRDIVRSYRALSDASKGIVRAQVTVAEEPSQTVVDGIRAALKDVAGDKVVVDLRIDPAIIGGIVVKLGSKMVDASLRTKLNGIRTAMKEVG
jgi:F-type H+-transporting ATPase subunit delta